ncbi:MAG: Gldg family protein [Burkholderiales bacterium]|nr:Gldg family protein [Burkholderiales bacterium]
MRSDTLSQAAAVARKEVGGYFASPAAFLFFAAFLALTMFVFFWVDTFFARGLADVRPLFQWMPVLMIFLVGALTMRSWADERRSGTIELLLTAPVPPVAQLLGKYLGVLALVAIALALTLPLPFTVALLGPLDWGPVVGGYVAALALASAYAAIGLWVSARTDNQIVSLIMSCAIAGVFYLVGSPAVSGLFGNPVGDWLRELGAGARFESITRGVLDLRDLAYYASITVLFLVLCRLALERLRWAGNPVGPAQRRWLVAAGLLAANAVALNLWLSPLRGARLDLTQGHAYTLSTATRRYLGELKEPLLIRGYFSARTHPLLAPLVPQLRDLLAEYAVAGGSKVHVEIIDPHDHPHQAEEAASRYGVRPVPFETSSKYQASVVNSYFDIVVAYGDQYQVLNFRDLIDVKARGEGRIDVALRNPEYDITRSIRKVLLEYQGGGSPFATLSAPLTLKVDVSADSALPPTLLPGRQALTQALAALRQEAGAKLKVLVRDPDTDPALAKRLRDAGLRPLVAGLFDPRPFWFQLRLSDGRQEERVALPQAFDGAGFQRSIEAAVKRYSPGFLKTVAVLTPAPAPGGYGAAPGPRFDQLRKALEGSVHWLDTDLHDGVVPAAADLLMVLAPENLSRLQLFAIDQFLMQGGTVIVATAPSEVEIGQDVVARPVHSGLEDWLAGYGLKLGHGLVMDRRSGALPIPVDRPLGNGMSVREIRLAPYPYFVDVRGSGLDAADPVTASLGQIDLAWAAPIEVDAKLNQGRRVQRLIRSSATSWVGDGTNLLPDYQRYPDLGFAGGTPQAPQTLALAVSGRFESAFRNQPSPLLQAAAAAASAPAAAASAPPPGSASLGRVIDHSPASARLVLVSSNAALSDAAMELASEASGTLYRKPVEFAQNLVEAAVEDPGLLALRGRSRYARGLAPLSRAGQQAWEYGNYALALVLLGALVGLQRRHRRARARAIASLLQEA